MVVVAAGDDVVARRPLGRHVLVELLALGRHDGGVGPVGGQMHVEEHELGVARGHAHDGVAAVQVEELAETLRNGQALAHRVAHGQARERGQPRAVGAVRCVEGPGEEGRVVVLAEHRPVAGELGAQKLVLVDVVAAGAVCVHFLEENEIRRERTYGLGRAENVLAHHLRAFGHRSCAAVHEEVEVAVVSAETEVGCHHGELLISGNDRRSLVGSQRRVHGERQIVGESLVGDHDVGDVNKGYGQKRAEQCEQNRYYAFGHKRLL